MGCNYCKNCRTDKDLSCVPHAVYELALEKAERAIFFRNTAIAVLGGMLLISNVLWFVLG